MKDKQLRNVLADSGVIKNYETYGECGDWVEPTSPTMGEKVDAIIKFLNIDFERKPEVLIAHVKVTPIEVKKNDNI